MQCHEFEQCLEQQVAPLPAHAAAHLDVCVQCRAVVADLDAIQAAARRLAAEEVEPPARLWLSLREQLEAEDLIRTPASVGEGSGWRGGWFGFFARPVLAGAYMAVLLVAAVLVGRQAGLQQNQAGPAAQTSLTATAVVSQLSTVERRTVAALPRRNPAVNDSLRQNLGIVDNFIALCEKSVREEPQNQMAREYLYGAYQQKAELLAAMMDRGTTGD